MVSLLKNFGEYNLQVKEFICDSDSEITLLPTMSGKGLNGEAPCAHGSECFSVASGKTFILSGDNS